MPEPYTGSTGPPEPSILLLLVRHLQPLAPPLAIVLGPMADKCAPRHPLVVHMQAGLPKLGCNPPATMASLLPSRLDSACCERLLIGAVLWNLSLHESVLSQCRAGAALPHAKRLPHMLDTATTARRLSSLVPHPRSGADRTIMMGISECGDWRLRSVQGHGARTFVRTVGGRRTGSAGW